MKTDEELGKYKIVRKGSGCSCGVSKGTKRYTLPFKITESIVPFVAPLGAPCFDFAQVGLLKIENTQFCLSSLRNTYYISFHQKKECPDLLDKFEDILILYVSSS